VPSTAAAEMACDALAAAVATDVDPADGPAPAAGVGHGVQAVIDDRVNAPDAGVDKRPHQNLGHRICHHASYFMAEVALRDDDERMPMPATTLVTQYQASDET
jgi:hypothetical protein